MEKNRDVDLIADVIEIDNFEKVETVNATESTQGTGGGAIFEVGLFVYRPKGNGAL